jgi:hypothetical protein
MKNLKAYKSSFLGFAIIVFSSFLIYKGITHDYWINGILYFIGLGLFFSGDGFINKFQDAVFSFFKNKSNNNDPTV